MACSTAACRTFPGAFAPARSLCLPASQQPAPPPSPPRPPTPPLQVKIDLSHMGPRASDFFPSPATPQQATAPATAKPSHASATAWATHPLDPRIPTHASWVRTLSADMTPSKHGDMTPSKHSASGGGSHPDATAATASHPVDGLLAGSSPRADTPVHPASSPATATSADPAAATAPPHPKPPSPAIEPTRRAATAPATAGEPPLDQRSASDPALGATASAAAAAGGGQGRSGALPGACPEPYRLRAVGHSLGGLSLLLYATLRSHAGLPTRIHRLILLTPAGYHLHYPMVRRSAARATNV